jgi:hypothetical protein
MVGRDEWRSTSGVELDPLEADPELLQRRAVEKNERVERRRT